MGDDIRRVCPGPRDHDVGRGDSFRNPRAVEIVPGKPHLYIMSGHRFGIAHEGPLHVTRGFVRALIQLEASVWPKP